MPTDEAAARPNRISLGLIVLAVAGAPLPFGSTERPAIALWCLVLGLAVLAASTRGLGPRQLAALAGIGVVVACYAVVLHEQLAAQPWLAAPHAVWSKASA